MKRMIVAALAATACAVGLLAAAPAQATIKAPTQVKAATSTLPPAIFLTPHQDDETLFMGAAIREHVLAGRDVKVILLTRGQNTGACEAPPINGDDAACTAERDREFIASVTKMGAEPIIPTVVAPGNSTARAGDTDGTLTGTFTANVIRYYAGIYGTNASFKTLSEYDSVSLEDHRAVGRGLYAAYLWGYIGTGPSTGDARFYLRPEDQVTYVGTCTARHNLNTALDLYEPVGWDSVPKFFAMAYDSVNQPYDYAAYSKSYTPAQRNVKATSNGTCYKGTYVDTFANAAAERAETP